MVGNAVIYEKEIQGSEKLSDIHSFIHSFMQATNIY